MNPQDISLLLSLISLGAVIWRAATESAQIKGSIKDVRDELVYKYDVELERIRSKMGELEYLNNANREQINHKAQRFESEIGSIKGYLQKKFDFQIRRYRPHPHDDDDDGPMSSPL